MKNSNYDVIVIGSGFGAAPPALRLVRAGFSTLVLEKGPFIDPMKDFKQSQDPNYLLTYLKSLQSSTLTLNYVEALGGGSGFYEKMSLRAPEIVFRQKDENDRLLWPAGINRQTLDPWYKIAEVMLRVHQIEERHVPKTGLVFSLFMKHLNYSVERSRYADTFCTGCGYCVFGCVHGGKESLLVNYIPKAREHGARYITGAEVVSIKPLPGSKAHRGVKNLSEIPPRFEVTILDRATGIRSNFKSKILVLAAGTIGTARLLMISKDNLPSLSHHIGKNIAINGSVRVAGLLPDGCPDGDMFKGQSHPGIISYEFFNSHKIMITAFKGLPLQIFGTARFTRSTRDLFWGESHVELMKKIRKRFIFLDAHGVTPPGARLLMDKNQQIRISMKLNDKWNSYYSRTHKILQDILVKNGCRELNFDLIRPDGMNYKGIRFTTAHQVGSCRMADSISDGVVDPMGEVFNYPGLFITDGSVVPSSTGVNISLTILANAERITQGIMDQYKSA